MYDYEPHTKNDIDLLKYNRLYQAKIYSENMKSGDVDFTYLPKLYVLTVRNFDL